MKKTEKKALDTFTQSVRVQMDKTLNTLDEKALDKAVKLIQKAEQEGNRVHVSGIGKPGHMRRLYRIPSLFHRNAELLPARNGSGPRKLRTAETGRCGHLYLQQR